MGRALSCAFLSLTLSFLAAGPLAGQGAGVVVGRVTGSEDGAPLAGAAVRAVGFTATAITDGTGRYTLRLPAGTHELEATLLGRTPARRTVVVAEGATSVADFALEPTTIPIDALVVVGTVGSPREAAATALPVEVVTADELAGTGFVEPAAALERLIPAFYAGRRWPLSRGPSWGGSLRGVPGGGPVVLVDGRRGRGEEDLLAVIPRGAIERIELLRGGAPALYGTDAAAGTINVVLKESAGGSIWSQAGERFDRGDGVIAAGGSYGVRVAGRGRAFASFEAWDRSPGGAAASTGRPNAQELRALVHGAATVGGLELFGVGIAAAREAEGWESEEWSADGWEMVGLRDASAMLGVRGNIGEWGWEAVADIGSRALHREGTRATARWTGLSAEVSRRIVGAAPWPVAVVGGTELRWARRGSGEARGAAGAAFVGVDLEPREGWSVLVAGRVDEEGWSGAARSGQVALRAEVAEWLGVRGRVAAGGRMREVGAGVVLTSGPELVAVLDAFRATGGVTGEVAGSADALTRGLDVSVAYGLRLSGGGVLHLRGAASWEETRAPSAAALPGTVEWVHDPMLLDASDSARPGSGVTLGASYRYAAFRLALNGRYAAPQATPRDAPSGWATDLTAAYTIRDRLGLSAGGHNLLGATASYFVQVSLEF